MPQDELRRDYAGAKGALDRAGQVYGLVAERIDQAERANAQRKRFETAMREGGMDSLQRFGSQRWQSLAAAITEAKRLDSEHEWQQAATRWERALRLLPDAVSEARRRKTEHETRKMAFTGVQIELSPEARRKYKSFSFYLVRNPTKREPRPSYFRPEDWYKTKSVVFKNYRHREYSSLPFSKHLERGHYALEWWFPGPVPLRQFPAVHFNLEDGEKAIIEIKEAFEASTKRVAFQE